MKISRTSDSRGGSRISHRGSGSVLGDMDLQCEHFSVKIYVKMKELCREVGGGRVRENFVRRFANE